MNLCDACNKPMEIGQTQDFNVEAYRDKKRSLHSPQEFKLWVFKCRHCDSNQIQYSLMPRMYSFLTDIEQKEFHRPEEPSGHWEF